MSVRFDRDTAVERLDEGVFSARLDPGWWIIVGPNGGYLAAILQRALDMAQGDPSRAARSLTVHYTAAPVEGPVRIETRIERVGGALTSLSGRMLQDETLVATCLAAYSKPRRGGVDLAHARMPEVPPPESCPPRPETPVEMHRRYDMRWGVGAVPFGGGSQALAGGWIRLEEPRVLDAPLATAYTDAFPPALFSVLPEGGLTGGVPTIDLTIHYREALPYAGAGPDDFTLAVFQTREGREGFIEEDGELWSPDGRLLVQSRQLALAR